MSRSGRMLGVLAGVDGDVQTLRLTGYDEDSADWPAEHRVPTFTEPTDEPVLPCLASWSSFYQTITLIMLTVVR
jgi:hypothetical protein